MEIVYRKGSEKEKYGIIIEFAGTQCLIVRGKNGEIKISIRTVRKCAPNALDTVSKTKYFVKKKK